MSLRPALYLLVAVLLAPAGGRMQEALPIPVFVTHLDVPLPPPMKPEQLQGTIAYAHDQMFEVAAKLRKLHGDKTSAWPPEVWKVFYDAEDEHTLAIARRDYQVALATEKSPRLTKFVDTGPRLADSVEDFIRGAGGNKAMTLVTTPDEAVLAVQITARRITTAPDPTDNRYFIRFRLVPGGKMTGERFLELTRDYKWNPLISKVIAHPKDASGYLDLEAGSMASYKNCAGAVRAILQVFILQRLDPAKKK